MVTNNSSNTEINSTTTFLGNSAGNFTGSGTGNVGIGHAALGAFTTGGTNVCIGESAGASITSAFGNVAIGPTALQSATIGSANVAIGNNALGSADQSNMIAIGNSSLQTLTGGIRNLGIGATALGNLSTGSNNIAIGFNAGSTYTGAESGNILIGSSNSGTLGESNVIRLGIQGTQTTCIVAGIRGATSPSGIGVLVSTAGVLGTTTSSIRFKEDVKNMGDASSRLLQCRPVTFFYKQDEENRRQYGMIAEEVIQVMPELVVCDENGNPEAIRYEQMICMLVNEVKKLNERIKKLEKN